MKNTILLFAAFLMMFSIFANAQDHEYHGEKKNHPKHFNNFFSTEIPFTFVGDTVLVGVKLNLHLNYFHAEDSKYCFTSIAGFESLHEDTITHAMFGAGRKWIFGNDVVLEAAIVAGAEWLSFNPRFGTTVTYHANNLDCFMSFDYAPGSKFFYRTYCIWYPERHLGFGGEVQKHSSSGLVVSCKPCSRFSLRMVNGVDLGYLVNKHNADGSDEHLSSKDERFKWSLMLEAHLDF